MSDQRSAQIPSLSLASSIPALFAAVSAGVLLVFTLLRETLIFWQNAGGYPLLLRDLVLYGFYPIILFCLGCIAMAVWRLIFVRRGSSYIWLTQTALVMVAVLLLTMALTMAVTDNVLNLIRGRPFHSHREG